MYIKTAKQAKLCIGQTVYWDDRARCIVNRGRLEDVKGKNLLIDGDYKWMPQLIGLRDFEGRHFNYRDGMANLSSLVDAIRRYS